MKRIFLLALAALVAGQFAATPNASAAVISSGIKYFDAQIYDAMSGGKSPVLVPANTTFKDGTEFTPFPVTTNSTGNNSDAFQSLASQGSAQTQADGNWLNSASGSLGGEDGLWRRRSNATFGNITPGLASSPALVGDILDARGSASSAAGSNNELAAVLKTTIAVPEADQGQLRSVWVFYWGGGTPADGRGGGAWQIAASLECCENPNGFPVFSSAGSANPDYSFMAYNLSGTGTAGAGLGDGVNDFVTTDAALNSSPGAGTGDRALWAAFLGNVELGTDLSVYAWHGPYVQANQENSGNFRTWYDGIGYGPAVDGLEPLPCTVPEPATLALVGLALVGFGLIRRR